MSLALLIISHRQLHSAAETSFCLGHYLVFYHICQLIISGAFREPQLVNVGFSWLHSFGVIMPRPPC